MKRYIVRQTLFFIILFLLTGCAQTRVFTKSAPVPDTPLVIENVSVNLKEFNPITEEVEIKFRLSKEAYITMEIYDPLNRKVWEYPEIFHSADYNTIIWGGRDLEGNILPDGVYVYLIKATSDDNKFVFNPANETAHMDLEVTDYSIDRDTGEISYVLPQAAWVRVRTGLIDGVLFNTLLDWEPQSGGRHVYEWDGWDTSHTTNLLGHQHLGVGIQAISLPQNCVILRSGRLAEYKDNPLAHIVRYDYPSRINPKVFLKEPQFQVIFPIEIGRTSSGLPEVTGIVPIRISLSEKDKIELINKRFEVMIYIDNVFLYEEEQAYTPFTFMWDTQWLNEGTHTITINIMSYDGRVGHQNIKVYKLKNNGEGYDNT